MFCVGVCGVCVWGGCVFGFFFSFFFFSFRFIFSFFFSNATKHALS